MSNNLIFEPHGYRIEKELGQNHTGGRITYLATDLRKDQSVVIKQFQFAQSDSNWGSYDAHQREIDLLRNLHHSSIPSYIESFETPSGFCLVQEYKHAESLADIEDELTLAEIEQVAIGVLSVLVYLQDQDPPIIHRDIKPENILVDRSNPLQFKVYLVDFGFAKISRENAASSAVKGTLGFMPPEQLYSGDLTEASDIYSLGVTLICLLTGTKSNDVGRLMDHRSGRFNYKPHLPKLNWRFIQWLDKAIAPNLKDRFKNAKEALRELKNINVLDSQTGWEKLLHWLKPKTLSDVTGLATLGLVAVFGTTLTLMESPTTQQNNNQPSGGNINVGYKELPSSAMRNYIDRTLEIQQSPSRRSSRLRSQYDRNYNRNLASNLKTLRETGSCRGCNLQGVSLRSFDLKGADLTGADLRGANLEGVNLTKAVLANANLKDANLKGANLYDASLWNTNLQNANLQRAVLDEALLHGTDLRGANLWKARLRNIDYFWKAKLDGTIMPDGKRYN